MNDVKKLIYEDKGILAATTLKDVAAPEKNNFALHTAVNRSAVITNQESLARECGIPLTRWVVPRQVHGDRILKVTSLNLDDPFEADALYTDEPNILLGVLTADCCSLLIHDEVSGIVAAIHSGWKGTAGAITWKSIEYLKKAGLNPSSAKVWFGPSLQFDSLEVGPEVVGAMERMAEEINLDLNGLVRPGNGDRFYIDNQGINTRMLLKAGIPLSGISLSSMDTGKLADTCFSYRRDRPLGEHFSFIVRKEDEHEY